MKKILLIIALLVACSAISAQVNKPYFDALMTKAGTSWGKIEKLYVGNTITVYVDGTIKRQASIFEIANENSFSLTDGGVLVSHSAGTPKASVVYFPFDKIKDINVAQTSVTITLVD